MEWLGVVFKILDLFTQQPVHSAKQKLWPIKSLYRGLNKLSNGELIIRMSLRNLSLIVVGEKITISLCQQAEPLS